MAERKEVAFSGQRWCGQTQREYGEKPSSEEEEACREGSLSLKPEIPQFIVHFWTILSLEMWID